MTVEERMCSTGKEGGHKDQFPVGMRVLAVDDDPICLKLLEALLLRCRYNVTTTSQAVTALKLLRENKDKFDLVISDVHMPDMDGFKLLELVGLEMDLPVIMLSANGETQAVMKGISHGACDYLLKPVRIEELRIIWQHVIRRRKFDGTNRNNLNTGDNCQMAQHANSGGRQGVADGNGTLNRKRKDQDEEEEDDSEENTHDNEDPSAQKKPRVVWSVELHRKFVAAVNQLGIDKAVPKKILDLMNVEKLTRENVASHLQKYRLYLKRLSAVTSQQANMVVALGGRNAYIHTNSMDGFRNYHALGGSRVDSRQLPTLTSFRSHGMLGRMNSPAAFGLQGFAPSQAIHLGCYNSNTRNPVNDPGKLQGISLLGNLQGNLLQGIPTSFELDRLQLPKIVEQANRQLSSGLCNSSFTNVTDNPLLLQVNKQQAQSGGLGSYSPRKMPLSSLDQFEIGLQDSSQFPDFERHNFTWQGAASSSQFSANTLPMNGAPISHINLSPINIGNDISPIVSPMDSNVRGESSSLAVAPLHDPLIGNDVHHVSSVGDNAMPIPTGIDEDPKYANFKDFSYSKQNMEGSKQGHAADPRVILTSSSNSSMPSLHINDPITQRQTLDSGHCNKNMEMDVNGRATFAALVHPQDCKFDKSTADDQMNFKDGCTLDVTKFQSGLSSTGCSYDDLLHAIIKPERDDVTYIRW